MNAPPFPTLNAPLSATLEPFLLLQDIPMAKIEEQLKKVDLLTGVRKGRLVKFAAIAHNQRQDLYTYLRHLIPNEFRTADAIASFTRYVLSFDSDIDFLDAYYYRVVFIRTHRFVDKHIERLFYRNAEEYQEQCLVEAINETNRHFIANANTEMTTQGI